MSPNQIIVILLIIVLWLLNSIMQLLLLRGWLPDVYTGCLYRMFIPDVYTGCLYRMFISEVYNRMFIPDVYTGCLYRMFIPDVQDFHVGFLLPSALARPSPEFHGWRGWAVHQQRDARADLVAGYVLRERQTSQLPHGYHAQRIHPDQSGRMDHAQSQVRLPDWRLVNGFW